MAENRSLMLRERFACWLRLLRNWLIPARPQDRGVVLRLLCDNTAASAVEFAIIGSTFLLLVCMMIELDLILFTQSVLDNAARDASRLIETGQIQNGGGSATPFTTQLCNDVGTLIPCSKLQYNVQSASTFAALNTTITTNGSGTMTGTGFSPGTDGQDVLVEVGYYRPTIIPWAGKYLYPNELLISTVAFQNVY
jgi:Flp pilus assembly protein TadG